MKLDIKEIESLQEYKKYIKAKQDFADVCKSGKDFYSCSIMDISIRSDRFDKAKNKLIKALGEIARDKLNNENQNKFTKTKMITK